jgi:hypothetical protein
MGGPRTGAKTQSKVRPAASSAGSVEPGRLSGGRRRWAAITTYLLAGLVLFAVYLRLSETYALNSDSANHWEPRALVGKYFGRPAWIRRTGPYTVLVWDKNLLLSIPR